MAETGPAGPLAPGAPGDLLADVESAVQAALESGSDDELTILGHGEITLVVGWPTERPVVACKRLPLFRGPADAERYGALFERYLEVLRERGVAVVPSSFHALAPDAGGRVAGYVVQPTLPAGSLGPDVLRAEPPDPEHPLLRDVVRGVLAVVDERTGLDAQISNWSLGDGAARYLDVTTPILYDDDGTLALDVGILTAAFPWALRAPIRRFVAPPIAAAYCDRRTVLLDLAGNLHKERLAGWVPAVLQAVNREVSPPITVAEVERYYRGNARLWEVMLRLRRADRWWQRTVRRRGYPFLLPHATAR